MRFVSRSDATRRRGPKQPKATIVTVLGGKSGVGKTNLAVGLALAAAQQGIRTCFVDAARGRHDGALLLEAAERSGSSVAAESPRGTSGTPGTQRRAAHFVGTITLDETDVPATALDCSRALERLRDRAELVIVDCGVTLDHLLVALASTSAYSLLATTSEPAALTDTYATLKHLVRSGFVGQVAVVPSIARSRQEATWVAQRLRHVAQRFLGRTLGFAGYVPFDRHVIEAVRNRVPLVLRYPRAPAARAIAQIAQRVCPRFQGPPVAGVWSRLAGLFL